MKHVIIDLNHAEVHKILHCLNECNHEGELLTELRSKFEKIDDAFNDQDDIVINVNKQQDKTPYDTGLDNQFVVAGKVFSDRDFK